MSRLLYKETNFEGAWRRMSRGDKEKIVDALQHGFDVAYSSGMMPNHVEIDRRTTMTDPNRVLHLFEDLQHHSDWSVVSNTGIGNVGSTRTILFYARAVDDWATSVERRVERGRLRHVKIIPREKVPLEKALSALEKTPAEWRRMDDGVVRLTFRAKDRRITFELRDTPTREVEGLRVALEHAPAKALKAVYQESPTSIKIITSKGPERVIWKDLATELGVYGPKPRERPQLITTIARYPTNRAATDSFLRKLGENATGMPTIRRGYLVFDLGQGRRVSIAIRRGKKRLREILGTGATTREEKKQRSRAVVDFIARGMEAGNANVVVGPIYYSEGGRNHKIGNPGRKRGFNSRDVTGVSEAARVALSLDFFLDPEAREWYDDETNLGKARTISRNAFGSGAMASSAHRAYITTLAAQAQINMGRKQQDGLAGDKTLTALREERKRKTV